MLQTLSTVIGVFSLFLLIVVVVVGLIVERVPRPEGRRDRRGQ